MALLIAVWGHHALANQALANQALANQIIANQITCTFDVNDVTKQLLIQPSNDVFQMTSIDLPGGFRFSGQYLTGLKEGDFKFKAYTYHTPKDRYVLLSLQEFSGKQSSKHPSDQSSKQSSKHSTCSQDFGRHRVYDSSDERELYFHCTKVCTR